MAPNLSLRDVRRLWAHHHGLLQPQTGGVADVIERHGWPRTLGGVDIYIALLSRNPQLQPADIDRAVCQTLQAQVIPAARSCIYVVPRAWVPVAMRYGYAGWLKRTRRDCEKAGALPTEMDDAAAAIAEVLSNDGKATDKLRDSLPAGAIRSLGEQGKKQGMASVLPAALRMLEMQGLASRMPADGHLRNERYVWQSGVNAGVAAVAESVEAMQVAVARHYFSVAAPARWRDFADWAGLGLKEAQAAAAGLGLQQCAVEGEKEPYWARPEQLAALASLPVCESPRLLSFVDPLLDYRASALKILVDPRHYAIELPAPGNKMTPIGALTSLWQRCICDDGELVGIWEFDPDRKRIDTALFHPLAADRQTLLAAEIARTETLLRDTLQDARAFSLDSDKSLRERAQWVRDVAQRQANS